MKIRNSFVSNSSSSSFIIELDSVPDQYKEFLSNIFNNYIDETKLYIEIPYGNEDIINQKYLESLGIKCTWDM